MICWRDGVCCLYVLLFFVVLVFFFKQKTAYELRISYWSSDVCSSDLLGWPSPGSHGFIRSHYLGRHAAGCGWLAYRASIARCQVVNTRALFKDRKSVV